MVPMVAAVSCRKPLASLAIQTIQINMHVSIAGASTPPATKALIGRSTSMFDGRGRPTAVSIPQKAMASSDAKQILQTNQTRTAMASKERLVERMWLTRWMKFGPNWGSGISRTPANRYRGEEPATRTLAHKWLLCFSWFSMLPCQACLPRRVLQNAMRSADLP